MLYTNLQTKFSKPQNIYGDNLEIVKDHKVLSSGIRATKLPNLHTTYTLYLSEKQNSA